MSNYSAVYPERKRLDCADKGAERDAFLQAVRKLSHSDHAVALDCGRAYLAEFLNQHGHFDCTIHLVCSEDTYRAMFARVNKIPNIKPHQCDFIDYFRNANYPIGAIWFDGMSGMVNQKTHRQIPASLDDIRAPYDSADVLFAIAFKREWVRPDAFISVTVINSRRSAVNNRNWNGRSQKYQRLSQYLDGIGWKTAIKKRQLYELRPRFLRR